MIRSLIGQRIKELRIQKGLSQEKLALNVELDRTYVASVENGKRNISIVNLEKIWKGLSVTPAEFFSSKRFEEKNE